MQNLARRSNVFYIKCGQHNVPSNTIREHFWEVDSYRSSQIYDYHCSYPSPAMHYTDNGPFHPFDTLHQALVEYPVFKNKKIMIFCKKIIVADYIAIRLRLSGFSAVSIHG